MTPDKFLIMSHVFHGDQCFFVSTIERDSSAAAAYGMRLNETIAWEFDWDKKQRGKIVAQTGDGAAISQHMRVCEQLFLNGRFDD